MTETKAEVDNLDWDVDKFGGMKDHASEEEVKTEPYAVPDEIA